MEMNS